MPDSSASVIDNAHTSTVEVLVKALNSDAREGISEPEAQRRLLQYGPNHIASAPAKSWWMVLLSQFKSPVVWVLIAATLLSAFFEDWVEAIAIALVIVINALIGLIMEWQALQSLQALKNLSKTSARVVRGGQSAQVDAEQLVPGDLLVLEAGDIVAADARLLFQAKLAVKESALTGESLPESKNLKPLPLATPLADRRNMLYKGTIITRGSAKALVTATGRQTELGKIGQLMEEARKEATPLEKKLNRLSRRLIILTLIIAVLIALLGILKERDLRLMIETAIALAVAAIPEGLPIVATIALARGMLRLSRRQVLVKSLAAVETLGEVNVICTDKTGTLTEDNMQVSEILLPDARVALSDIRARADDPQFRALLLVCTLCNNASYQAGAQGQSAGDPLEVGLLKLVQLSGYQIENWREQYPREAEIPFDSEHKYMASLHRTSKGYLATLKGAPEVVLARCRHFPTATTEDADTARESWNRKAMALAGDGLRVLAFAQARFNERPQNFERDLDFSGFVGFLDPPRKDVSKAVQLCHQAGIRVLMITGDHPGTARNIALQTSISEPGKTSILPGSELKPDIPASQLLQTDIFARVNPTQKLELVRHFQQNQAIVAMTGDGVNDAPALRKADIGIAMGIRGTEAAREAADLILKDDAFPSIVVAIRQGRIIFENIRHFVVYLISCNISEILIVAIASLAMLPMPLLPLQILFLNIVTDVFPALALGMGNGHKGIMDVPPRPSGEAIITRPLWGAILSYSLAITLSVIALVFYAGEVLQLDAITANNLAFYTLILAQLWHVFNLASRQTSFFYNEVTRNPHVWLALVFCLLLSLSAFMITPVRMALNLEISPSPYLGLMLIFSLAPLLMVQLLKRALKWIA